MTSGELGPPAAVVLARVGQRLIPTFDRIHEAMRRHRVERFGGVVVAAELADARVEDECTGDDPGRCATQLG